ncbi:UDP-glucose 4-epimerase GalE [Oxalobacteraceae bacterium OM1]|nr:UDP-glucose 4-epimerase GalE [Oxalobacteraceae bacterium OM1]
MDNRKTVLVTGGAGYIGSHVCIELLNAGYGVVVVDNLCNSSHVSLARVEQITGQALAFVQTDIRDKAALDAILATHPVDAVIHLAGLKAVGESVQQPVAYYDNNVGGTIALLQALDHAGVRHILFSSSATVYGVPETVPLAESARLGPTNPYGRTKLMVEQMLTDWRDAAPGRKLGLLRYFNPAGAHASGLIGEDPRGVPNNLLPFVAQVAVGRLQRLSVFGDDYPTPDGTGVRDYIHITDLARGHVAALGYLLRDGEAFTVNLGTGRGYSVLEVVRAFERASGTSVPYAFAARRPGDVAACYADPSRAAELFGWRAEFDLDDMCADQWRWQSRNPAGYD